MPPEYYDDDDLTDVEFVIDDENEEDLPDETDADDEDDYIAFAPVAAVPEAPKGPETFEYSVAKSEAGERLDKLVAAQRPDLSRAHIQRLTEEGRLHVNGKQAKAGLKLRGGENITLYIPAPKPLAHLAPENIPLDIIYEDADVIVINKPAGLVVHPAAGHASGTLVNALLHHVPNLNINGNQRPGIVHRLDKDTSGLLVAAKTDAALNNLILQMKNRETLKEYLTLVEGNLQPPLGIIDAPIGRDPKQRKQMAVVRHGKAARTHYKTLEYLENHTLVEARLETGRTHQIRVHFAYMRHPVVGDPVYGYRKASLPLRRQFLHAAKLGFKLPSSGEYREFEAPLPADLSNILEKARLTGV
jgi:23S rRNA pseudouridine1911/1915/1917 synthase